MQETAQGIKFGLFVAGGDIREIQAQARQAESMGFYSVTTNDHFFSPFGTPETPQLECFTVLTAIAAVTERVRIGPSVAAASFRSPAMLAKIATTLDHVSAGRLELGLGSGWLPGEYRAHGYDFPPTPVRLAQLAETVQIVKAMWTQDTPRFKGEFFEIDGAMNQPRPVQRPHPPLMLGGSGEGLLRIAAEHADIINLIPPTGDGKDFPNDPEATLRFDTARLKQRIARLRELTEAAGRDPGAIEVSGLALLCVAESADDPAPRQVAESLGFPDYATAQRSPVALLGTPDEIRQELGRRIEDTEVRYTIVAAATPDSARLFGEEVLPAFRA
jgi:probable F420-dependent oxidoreductase